MSDLQRLWRHLFGDQRGHLCIFAGTRARPGDATLTDERSWYYPYPASAAFAEGILRQQAARPRRETYFCAHLLTGKSRRKAGATMVHSLWADLDRAIVPPTFIPPTALVQSSPGRLQGYWRLSRPLEPAEAEALNKRLTSFLGADPGGWDLTQLLRPPGLPNRKREAETTVEIIAIDDGRRVDPDELDRLLPPAPAGSAGSLGGAAADLSGDEPPVRLGPHALACWRGQRPILKDDGTVDRSTTLFNIARELARANAAEHVIAAALAERDAALGYRKFADRPQQYAKAAAAALDEIVAQGAPAADAPAAPPAEVERLRREVDRYRTAYASMRRVAERRFRRMLAAEAREREVRAVAAHPFHQGRAGQVLALARAVAGADERDRRDDGYTRVQVWRMAKQSGCSGDSISDAIGALKVGGVVATDYAYTSAVNKDTGQREIRRELLVKLDVPSEQARDETAVLAYLNRRAPRRRRTSDDGHAHGGARPSGHHAAPAAAPASPAPVPPSRQDAATGAPAPHIADDVRSLPPAAAWIIGAPVETPDGDGTVAMVEASYRLAVVLATGDRRWYALDDVRWAGEPSPSAPLPSGKEAGIGPLTNLPPPLAGTDTACVACGLPAGWRHGPSGAAYCHRHLLSETGGFDNAERLPAREPSRADALAAGG